MSIQFSPILRPQTRGNNGTFSVTSVDLRELRDQASAVTVLDDFRVRGQPFGPHPHAGFSAVTYVFEDSEAALRSRDSLGNDIVVGAGGIVWTQAGRGVVHEELPAQPDRELHGLQVFVNLSSKNKLIPPQVHYLPNSEVPEWRSDVGDRVRVVVGSFEGLISPLAPAEPFNILDVHLRREITFDVQNAHHALMYVLTGNILVRADGREQQVPTEHAVALHGGSGRVGIEARGSAHLIILSGPEIRERVIAGGSFIMNEPSQIEAAIARYRRGEMGQLVPAANLGGLPESR